MSNYKHSITLVMTSLISSDWINCLWRGILYNFFVCIETCNLSDPANSIKNSSTNVPHFDGYSKFIVNTVIQWVCNKTAFEFDSRLCRQGT